MLCHPLSANWYRMSYGFQHKQKRRCKYIFNILPTIHSSYTWQERLDKKSWNKKQKLSWALYRDNKSIDGGVTDCFQTRLPPYSDTYVKKRYRKRHLWRPTHSKKSSIINPPPPLKTSSDALPSFATSSKSAKIWLSK